jgi:purine-binding chemotaxis protein CheW
VAPVSTEKQYVVFRLMGQHYAAAIDVVREVTYQMPVTRLPNTPPFVEGVIDLRGEILPVVDLRTRLGLPAEHQGETRLMILNLGERSVALKVDGVDQVQTLRDEEITPPDAQVTVVGQDYVQGVARVGDSLVVLLDLARLMDTTPGAA